MITAGKGLTVHEVGELLQDKADLDYIQEEELVAVASSNSHFSKPNTAVGTFCGRLTI